MTTGANALKNNRAAGRYRVGKTGVRGEAVRKSRAMLVVVLIGAFCLLIVTMSAYAANLRRINNELQTENAYLQAEIDSLENQIGDATSINKIEDVAIKELGMVHPDADQCVTIRMDEKTDINLASIIKEEAYD